MFSIAKLLMGWARRPPSGEGLVVALVGIAVMAGLFAMIVMLRASR